MADNFLPLSLLPGEISKQTKHPVFRRLPHRTSINHHHIRVFNFFCYPIPLLLKNRRHPFRIRLIHLTTKGFDKITHKLNKVDYESLSHFGDILDDIIDADNVRSPEELELKEKWKVYFEQRKA